MTPLIPPKVNTAELDLGKNDPSQNPPLTLVECHLSGNSLPVPNNRIASVNSAVSLAPMAAGPAIASDCQLLVVANYYNDSIAVFAGGLNALVAAVCLRLETPQCSAAESRERRPDAGAT